MAPYTEVQTLRWILFAPLLGAVINGLLGARIQKRFGKPAIWAIACAAPIVSFLLSCGVFLTLRGMEPEHRALLDRIGTWIHSGHLRVDLAFWADPLSAMMILVITGIGGLIHLYSIGYMAEEESTWRYFAYLNLFTFAMLTLVLGDSLLLLFVGWEGVGLCSYALIGFWYRDLANARAGLKAFVVNRIGDLGFVIGMFGIFWCLDRTGQGTLVVREIAARASLLDGQTIAGLSAATFITLMLFVGATGKSAQIPLYVWLPDAMAGPTPVSALIHAATMVTAGVYMIGRMSFLFDMAPATLHLIACIGAVTALMAASIGLVQNDIKKVLAYSTVSQLGYMFIGMGVGAYSAGIFHLLTHAFFKACLFLGSGSVILACHHEQDMRRMGGLRDRLPVTFWTFAIAAAALAGVPPLAGFFSKDEILARAFMNEHGAWYIWAVGAFVPALTGFYMTRQVAMVFFGDYRGGHDDHGHGHAAHDDHAHGHGGGLPHESPRIMTMPLVILAVGSVLVGFLNVPSVLGGSHLFETWLEPVLRPPAVHEFHGDHSAIAATEWLLMFISLGMATGGILLGWLTYVAGRVDPARFSAIGDGGPYRLLLGKYFVDEIYEATVVRGTLALTEFFAAFDRIVIDGVVNGAAMVVRLGSMANGAFDRGVIDGFVNLVGAATLWLGNRARSIQTGHVYSYLYVAVIGFVVMLFVRLL